MQIHDVKRTTKRKMYRQRGRGGKRGKTAGRGTKGMLARAGYKRRPEIRDVIKRLPKLRGYNFKSIKTKPTVINFASLDVFKSGDLVNPKTLKEKGIIKNRSGKTPEVKILGDGEISKKLIVSECKVSAVARAKIEKAGGTIS